MYPRPPSRERKDMTPHFPFLSPTSQIKLSLELVMVIQPRISEIWRLRGTDCKYKVIVGRVCYKNNKTCLFFTQHLQCPRLPISHSSTPGHRLARKGGKKRGRLPRSLPLVARSGGQSLRPILFLLPSWSLSDGSPGVPQGPC